MSLVIREKLSPNHDERTEAVDMLILHYTGMKTAKAALDRLCDPSLATVTFRGHAGALEAAFLLGLMHGFGFSSTLMDLDLPVMPGTVDTETSGSSRRTSSAKEGNVL